MPDLRRLVSVDGCVFRITSRLHAEPDSPFFVLIHGIGMSHRYLTRLHRMLSFRGSVATIDLPGFGGLPKPGEDLDIARMADLLAAVLPAVTERRIVVVGHSMGAQWAVELAVRHPDAVQGVVAIGPVADDAHRTLTAQARALAVDTLGESPLINLVVFTDYLRCGIRWYLIQARHMLSHPLEDRVAALTVPLLVIRGEKDPIAGRDWTRRLRDLAPVSRCIEVPGKHHVVQQSAPRAVASAILSHVAGAWPRSLPVEVADAQRGDAA